MAKCGYCEHEMKDRVSCIEMSVELSSGKKLPQVPYGKETRGNYAEGGEDCHDCSTPVGGFHHPGCDVEECPNCHLQLISCDCMGDDEEAGEGGPPYDAATATGMYDREDG